MKKRIFSIVLALAMVLTALPFAGLAAFAALDGFAGGTGMADAPYEIATKAQLEKLAELVNAETEHTDAYFVLTANIGTADDAVTTVIGSQNKTFKGHFDGNGHTVTLAIQTETEGAGLFGGLAEGGEIKNVTTAGSVQGARLVGGVCGYNGGTVTDCCNTGEVKSSITTAGGVCGDNRGTVINCCNTGNVSSSPNDGNASASAGGVCGNNYIDCMIINCYNTGNVSGKKTNVAGISGNNSGIIINCYNTGTVTGETQYVAGVCGTNAGGTVTNCYNAGAVNGSSNVGGVCGYNSSRSGTIAGTITNCYNAGTVSGSSNVGGVCGFNKGTPSPIITNCYYDVTVYMGEAVGNNAGTVENSEGLTTAQMQAVSGKILDTGKADNKPLVDLLNAYVKDQTEELKLWGNKENEYPVFLHIHQVGTKHEAVAATCNKDATVEWYSCIDSSCEAKLDADGKELTDIIVANSKLAHSFTKYISNGNATCTADGTKTAICDICKIATDTVADAGTKLGHSFTGKAKSNGNKTHSLLCKNGCGEYGAAVDCVDADGNKTCDVCGGKIEQSGLEKLNKGYEPCTNHVNAICEIYDAVESIPVLNFVFYFFHLIIHLVKG